MKALESTLFSEAYKKLKLSGSVFDKSKMLFNKLDFINKWNWQGAIAACIYIECTLLKERRTQYEVAAACEVSARTLHNNFKRIMGGKEKYGIL